MNCPNCNNPLLQENINIQTDIAQCHSCQHIFKISEYVLQQSAPEIDLDNPPKGVWMKQEITRLVIGATTRSPIAFFMVPFMLVWSGGSIGGIYGTQIINGEFNLVLSLFGIPFLLGAILFWAVTFMVIWGKVEITLEKHGGRIFSGIGSVGITKKFNWEDISKITITHSSTYKSRNQRSVIQLEGRKLITFGQWLSQERRYYLLKALQRILHKVKTNNSLF